MASRVKGSGARKTPSGLKSNSMEDVLKVRLSRYAYQHDGIASKSEQKSAKSHAEVLAAIDSGSEDADDTMENKDRTEEEGEEGSVEESDSSSSSSSSSGRSSSDSAEESGSSDEGGEESDTLDDLLRDVGGSSTQKEDFSPMRYLEEILDGKAPSSGGGTASGDRKVSPAEILSLDVSPKRLDNSPQQPTSSTPKVGSSGASNVSPLVMLQQLQQNYQQPATTPTAVPKGPNGYAEPLFRKGKEIGSGGFGVVFQAVLAEGKLAAVKQLPITDQRGIDKEMRIMCNLPPHPHCVQYLGARRTKHHVYMVMEYVSGGSIQSLRSSIGKLPESVAIRYAHMTLLGLLHLHSHNIVHQDIKGANVLLDEKGCAKIADFGCIKDLNPTVSVGSTQGGGGTPLWMAPEVCRGESASMKSDVWSFGCFFLEMVNETGLPWSFRPGTSLQGAGYAIGSATQPPPFPQNLSPLARDFLNSCLAIQPSRRSTVAELLKHRLFTTSPSQNSEADFYRSVQSNFMGRSSSGAFTTLQTNTTDVQQSHDEPFVLDRASESDDDVDSAAALKENPLRPFPDGGSRPSVRKSSFDQGEKIVWRSEGNDRVPRDAPQR